MRNQEAKNIKDRREVLILLLNSFLIQRSCLTNFNIDEKNCYHPSKGRE